MTQLEELKHAGYTTAEGADVGTRTSYLYMESGDTAAILRASRPGSDWLLVARGGAGPLRAKWLELVSPREVAHV